MIAHKTGKHHVSTGFVAVGREPVHGDAFKQRGLASQSTQRGRPIAVPRHGQLLQGECAERPAAWLDDLRQLCHGHVAASEAQGFEGVRR